MFFFIAGVQPRIIHLDEQPRMCAACGLYQARLKRTDHYLAVFFLPILPVRRGSPYLECQSCGNFSNEHENGPAGPPGAESLNCSGCGKKLEQRFRYCPYCGKSR